MNPITLSLIAPVVVLGSAVGLALAVGGPGEPTPMPSINDPFQYVDFTDLPAPDQFTARDGSLLAYRYYAPVAGTAKGSVVLVHGSSASSSSMHPMATAFLDAGYVVCSLDMRGHGESGPKGRIAYIGQLEDDVEDFMRAVKPIGPTTLVGFSSGGGFVLRFAGSERQGLFSSYLLLSPFISQDAPTYRPNSGGWVTVGLPRYIVITMLNAFGIRVFNDLTVIRFALNEEDKSLLTPQYSYALTQNFRPKPGYGATIRAVEQPLSVLAGQDDEAFHTDRFAEVFAAAGKPVPVALLPGIGHIALTLDADAIDAAVDAVQRLQGGRGRARTKQRHP